MEMVIIVVVAVVAFAAVLVPLFRKGTRSAADAREFDGEHAAEAPAQARATGGGRPRQRKGGAPADRPAPGASPADRPARKARPVSPPPADPDAGEGIVPPIAAGPATPVAPTGATAPDAPAEPTVPDAAAVTETAAAPADPVEREVARYREALRAGTICRKCGEANAPGSRFCADCGSELAADEEREFA
jgi:hypothetical protein